MLNGAFFNRIGSRIAEQPYLKSIVCAFWSLTSNNTPVSTTEINYSKKFVPNNLPPANGNNLNFTDEFFNVNSESFLLYRLRLYATALSRVLTTRLNEKLSRPFKKDLFRPPCHQDLSF